MSQDLGQPKCRLPINNAEIHGLSSTPQLGRDLVERQLKDFARHAAYECLHRGRTSRAAYWSRKSGRGSAARSANSRRRTIANSLPAETRRDSRPPALTNRNVLQIRILRTQPAGRCDILFERSVNSFCLRKNESRQCVGVRTLEVRDLSIRHNLRGQRVNAAPIPLTLPRPC